MDQILNLYEALIVVATIVGGATVIVWIWMMRNSSNNHAASGDGDLSSKRRPSCTPPAGQDYEVFLSFRGEDTRKEFTDHLYNRLNDSGVWVFRDNEGLHVGEKIGPELIKAIKASKISIPIISPNYASSEWCLRELVQILECKKSGQTVLPIFYRVTPSDVRNQTGEFGKAFLLHQKKYSSNDIQEWRNTLKEVASLKGLESNKIADGHEGELVKIVLRRILERLKKVNLVVADHLVGVKDHIEKITKMVHAKETNEVHVILIHGMGGIGKTTLAKLIYNQFSTQNEYCSFLPNIRERSADDKGKVDLQKQLISDILGQTWVESIKCIDDGVNIIKERFKGKKVLVLLDDVDHRDQLNALAGESNWFGPGSIVIITSRNMNILAKWENRLMYELNELDHRQSFQLFCFHAFGRDTARQCELEPIAKEIVSITGGLPLAIEVIGSLLFAKPKESWEEILKILIKTPNDEVMRKLKISYDYLNYAEKQIFLDISCFYFEAKRNFAYYMWDACGFYPRERIKNLISLSLIKIGEEDQLIMHDQLKDLGRAIVREESFEDLGKCSRLWIKEEAWEVLNEKQGTEKVEAISLECDKWFQMHYYLTSEHFKGLTKLRLLRLDNTRLDGDFHNLLTNLRWLQWRGSKTAEFMPTNFNPRKLVVLDLEEAPITEHWSGWSQIEMVKKLKVISLKHCYKLTRTPDFSAFKELEILILEGCMSLTEIHPSIYSVCKTLITLDLTSCNQLEELPVELGEMEKLKELIVDGSSVREIPIFQGSMTELEIISANHCKMLSKLPDSFDSLVNLHTLSLEMCKSLTKIPESIGKLGALSKLNLSYTQIVEIPESIGNLQNLEELDISYIHIEWLTPAVGKLRKLKVLRAELLNIKEIPDIGELTSLQHLSLRCSSGISCLPASFYNLSSLQTLNLEGCYQLTSLPDLPYSLTSLSFQGDSMETLPSFSNLTNLKVLKYFDRFWRGNKALYIGNLMKLEELDIRAYIMKSGGINPLLLEFPSSLVNLSITYCTALFTLPDLSNLKCLTHFNLYGCPEIRNINGLEGAKNLKELSITHCSNIVEIQWLNNMESLQKLAIQCCSSLERIGHLSLAKKLIELELEICKKLTGVEGISQLTFLQSLSIKKCPSIETIGNLSHLKKLIKLKLEDCEMLSGVEGINQLSSLIELGIYTCPCLESIGELSNLKRLKELNLYNCKMLSGVEGIGQLTSLKSLSLRKLPCFKTIGDLSHLKNLTWLTLYDCEMLIGAEGIEKLTSLRSLRIGRCNPMFKFPDTSKLTNLRD